MNQVSELPAGWNIPEWVHGCGIARPTYYTLPADCKPTSVKIGKRVIIIESPAAWLERMRARGGVKTAKLKKAA